MLVTMVLSLASAASSDGLVIRGSGLNGQSPSSNTDQFRVHASRSIFEGQANGILETEGKTTAPGFGPEWVGFTGEVTCIALIRNRAIVGAFGNAWEPAYEGGEHIMLPGTYAQVLTLEFGEYPKGELGAPFYNTFAALGSHDQGVPSDSPPTCGQVADFSHQQLPESGGTVEMSPEITTPAPNTTVGSIVKVKGTGQALQTLYLYDLPWSGGPQVLAHVNVNKNGKWSKTLHGLVPGYHFLEAGMNHSSLEADSIRVAVEG